MNIKNINIKINDTEYIACAGQTIIEIADNNNIYIPRFCYHKKLSIAANCRMCLVDVKGSNRPMAACSTPVMNNMEIFTTSAITKTHQESILELLLLNHPLDCPICDQAGECELQDLTLEYSKNTSRYEYNKRVIPKKNIGPLIETDLTRCIHCTRCVRFFEDITGESHLAMMNRSESMELDEFLENTAIKSIFSGNIIDLCPVGALTNKPYRYTARPWELSNKKLISMHDSMGSNITAHIYENKFIRAVPYENETINEIWLSDRDRYGIYGLHSSDKLNKPYIKIDNKLTQSTWNIAINHCKSIINETLNKYGSDKIAIITSSNNTLEELYLLQKFIRNLGSNNIDHRINELDFSQQDNDELFPTCNFTINELLQSDCILIIGSNIKKYQPILYLRLQQASLRGVNINLINIFDYNLNFTNKKNILCNYSQLITKMHLLFNMINDNYEDKNIDKDLNDLSNILKNAKNPIIIEGEVINNHKDKYILKCLLEKINQKISSKSGTLTIGCNSAGAYIAGAVPHRLAGGIPISKPGLNAKELLNNNNDIKLYILFNIEAEIDTIYGEKALESFYGADNVISITPFTSDVIRDYSNVILPLATYNQSSGTYVNNMGTWQSFNQACIINDNESEKEGWKIICNIAQALNMNDFGYKNTNIILSEIKDIYMENNNIFNKSMFVLKNIDLKKNNLLLSFIDHKDIYQIDNIVRRSKPLQLIQEEISPDTITISPYLAMMLSVKNDDLIILEPMNIKLFIIINNNVPSHNVLLYRGKKNNIFSILPQYWENMSIKKI